MELVTRISLSKQDGNEMERLIADYMPFIKKSIADTGGLSMEYDDKLSLAMLSFMNCVRQYETGRGSFTAFASTCIRNRLIDENRRHTRHAGRLVPLFREKEDSLPSPEERLSVDAYHRERERTHLSDEIDVFSEQLEAYGVSFKDLPRICPKQERARRQCLEIGRYVAADDGLRTSLLQTRRLAQAELAKTFGLSEKTIEKHRRYIVTIVLLLAGDYPMIRAFLPQYKEV